MKANSMLKVDRYPGFGALPKPYIRVFEQTSAQSFFLSLPWFQNFEQTIVARDEIVVIYGVEEASCSHLLAALALRYKRERERLFSPKVVEGLSNYYTSYFGPVLASDHVEIDEISREFASALWSDRRLWDVLKLQPLDQTSPLFSSLVKAFKEEGMVVQTYFCFGNWYLDVAGRSYAEYIMHLPTVLKKNIPYISRKLERTFRVRVEIITSWDGLGKALDDYEKVYNSSWRRKPEPYPAFIRGLARTAMENGWLRLGLVYLDDEPAAAQIWIVHADIASIYKVCYDERFSNLSVGTFLTAKLMKHVLDTDKVREVDYLSGDDAYKKDWMSHRRERWGILVCNPRSVKGIMQIVRHVGGRSVKRILKTIFQ